MNNKYIFTRHGESMANFKDIICSTLPNGTLPEYGLTELGLTQVNQTAKILSTEFKNQEVIIFCSPFTRATQTALIIKEKLNVSNTNFFISLNLNERDFGLYELQSSKEYSKVWEADNSDQDIAGIESCKEVAIRFETLFKQLEKQYKGKTIILVSHGDTIMIARTVLLKDSPYNHRDYDYIKNAECLVFN
jgi:glucosyl-3-phosphoglycerate phosphatase